MSACCGAVAVMAALSSNFIRVRLYFDYPPPAVVDCRMCWLLVDLNSCRVVADLESLIREKFEFGRRSILSLFIEDCYLPHTESVYVVRDNDSVRCARPYRQPRCSSRPLETKGGHHPYIKMSLGARDPQGTLRGPLETQVNCQ